MLLDAPNAKPGLILGGQSHSHGQGRKRTLGRVVVRRPLLAVPDEPTVAQPQAENDRYNTFAGAARPGPPERGGTGLLVSHRFSVTNPAIH